MGRLAPPTGKAGPAQPCPNGGKSSTIAAGSDPYLLPSLDEGVKPRAFSPSGCLPFAMTNCPHDRHTHRNAIETLQISSRLRSRAGCIGRGRLCHHRRPAEHRRRFVWKWRHRVWHCGCRREQVGPTATRQAGGFRTQCPHVPPHPCPQRRHRPNLG